jgi:hypothetical protein
MPLALWVWASVMPAASSQPWSSGGLLASQSPRAPLRLVFPAALASRWMPGLFPEKHV